MMQKVYKVISVFLVLTISFFLHISVTYAITASSEAKYEGIDVSNWQGYINYQQVKANGIDIVYIKASEGNSFKDPYFEYNYANAKANGLKVGFYHFLTATNTEQARNQAQFFASVISGKSVDCKLAMDFEKFNGGISTWQINQISEAFLQRLQKLTGKEVVIYSNLSDSQSVFGQELANEYPIWVAYWGNRDILESNSSNWNTWEGWQYTNRGIVGGVNGYVDRNRFTENILLEECTNCPVVDNPNPEQGKTIEYTVRRGDTLSQIALRYGTTVQEIAQTNGISNPNVIYSGQVLRITVNGSATIEQTNEMGHIIYTVKRGDNLWSIARIYNTTVQEIVNLNGIRNPNLIYPGQKLRIQKQTANNGNNMDGGGASLKYTVVRGDTLWGIARRYGVTVNYLVNLNGIRNPRLIYAGQVIKIR